MKKGGHHDACVQQTQLIVAGLLCYCSEGKVFLNPSVADMRESSNVCVAAPRERSHYTSMTTLKRKVARSTTK